MSLKKDNLNFPTSRRFAPLFGTQFLGAFNDNMFKTALFVMISFYGLGKNNFLPASQMLNLGALLFILPYFLFSALSGQLSTKFDKAVLARWIKVLEIIIMAVAAFGFYIQSAPLLLVCLFCMGAQSTLFGPLKYAILPDYLNDKELIMGNSLIESNGTSSKVRTRSCVKPRNMIPFSHPSSAYHGFGLSARFTPPNCRLSRKSIWAATTASSTSCSPYSPSASPPARCCAPNSATNACSWAW